MQFSVDKIDEMRNYINNNRKERFNVHYSDPSYNLTNVRLFVSASGNICEFNKGSRKYGHYLPYMQFLTGIEVAESKKSKFTEQERFEKNAKKLVSILRSSGLWAKIVDELENKYKFEYAEMIKFEADFAYSILNWNVKKMNFRPKYRKFYAQEHTQENERKLEYIKMNMQNKKSCSVTADGNYDVRFNYDAEKGMAWYSEEYKGCGNGHYYLAIDDSHAIYYEKD